MIQNDLIFDDIKFPKDKEKEIREILEIDTSQIQDDVVRFSIDAIHKFCGIPKGVLDESGIYHRRSRNADTR